MKGGEEGREGGRGEEMWGHRSCYVKALRRMGNYTSMAWVRLMSTAHGVFDGNIPHVTCPFDGERYASS